MFRCQILFGSDAATDLQIYHLTWDISHFCLLYFILKVTKQNLFECRAYLTSNSHVTSNYVMLYSL